LRGKNDFPLWAKTVFDEDRTASWILEHLKKLEKLTRKIREK